MECFTEKEAKILFFFLAVCLLLGAAADWRLYGREEEDLARMATQQAGMAASALLESGMSPVEAGRILSAERITPEGAALVEQIGRAVNGQKRLPAFAARRQTLGYLVLGKEILLAASVAGGIFLYLKRREGIYEKAAEVMEGFLSGKETGKFITDREGTVYRLFSLMDSLAKALMAGKEQETQNRDFLKRTISDISHQLKTPLAAASMYNEIIRGHAGEPEIVREFAERTASSLERMEELIGMLLKLARLDAGSIRFEKRICRAGMLAEQAVSELRVRAKREGKTLEIQQDDQTLFCDDAWSTQALQNLVKNALDHTVSGGRIRISWEKTPLLFSILVTDDGEGIGSEEIYHIFKRFYRGRKSGRGSGIGLGLPLARSIMEGQGGSVGVRSVPGTKTVFFLTFPSKL